MTSMNYRLAAYIVLGLILIGDEYWLVNGYRKFKKKEPQERETAAHRCLVVIGPLCGDPECVQDRIKFGIKKCFTSDMHQVWEECLAKYSPRKARYTSECTPAISHKVYDCVVAAVYKRPKQLMPHKTVECAEGIITLKHMRCTLEDLFFEKYNPETYQEKIPDKDSHDDSINEV